MMRSRESRAGWWGCSSVLKVAPLSAETFSAARVAPLSPVIWIALLVSSAVKTRSEEHTSELQSLMRISYAVFCLKKKKNYKTSKYYRALELYRNDLPTIHLYDLKHHV